MKVSNIKNYVYVVDVETNGLEATPESFVFGCVYSHTEKYVFEELDKLKNFLLTLKKGSWVFAHNGEYDYTCIFGNIINMDRQPLFVKSKFMCFTVNDIKFADSMNIYPTSLSELGKAMGLEKGITPDKFKTKQKVKQTITEEDIEYCYRDCEIVHKALIEIFELVGEIKLTIGSLSMSYFSKQYNKRKLITTDKAQQDFRNAYYGGRTECFIKGTTEKGLYYYDINSLYPYIMQSIKFPDPLYSFVVNNITLDKFITIMNDFEGCAYISFTHKPTQYGYLPYRGEENKLIFPNGKMKGYYCFPEIRKAIKDNIITDIIVHKVNYSYRIDSPFKAYINDLYNLRKQSTGVRKEIYKRLMNHLYGKYAQGKYEKRIYFINDKEQLTLLNDNKNVVKTVLFNNNNSGYVELELSDKYPKFTCPQLAAYVTCEARLLMLNKLLEISKNNKIWYMDTDSIFIENMLDNSSNELGDFKLEDERIYQVNGLKDYISDKKRVLKGVKRNAVKIDEDTYEQVQMIKTKTAIKNNKTAGVFVNQIKTSKPKKDKRKFVNNESVPLSL